MTQKPSWADMHEEASENICNPSYFSIHHASIHTLLKTCNIRWLKMIHFIGTTFIHLSNKLLIKIEIILQLRNCYFSFYIAFASKAILTLHTWVALKWLHLRWYPRHLNNNLYQDIKNKSSHEPFKALSGVISIYLSQKALTC